MKQAPANTRFAAVAVDIVIFTIIDDVLCVLLGIVDRPPHYQNIEACIGGLVEVNETTEAALHRHLQTKTTLQNLYIEQLYTFSEIERDKRNRVISVSYLGLVRQSEDVTSLPEGLRWCPVHELPKLAYDHSDMFAVAYSRLKGKLAYTTIAQFLLPKTFTLTELQRVYELITGAHIDKRNFRKKLLSLDVVKETGRMQEGMKNRPAALYTFKTTKLVELPLLT